MYLKYVTAEAEKKLISKLNLPEIESQDWEYEVADSSRINEFLKAYETFDLDLEEKFALMVIIIASYNDKLEEGVSDDFIWKLIRKYLIKDLEIHINTIIYWSLKTYEEELVELDGGFAITNLMIEVYDFCKLKRYIPIISL